MVFENFKICFKNPYSEMHENFVLATQALLGKNFLVIVLLCGIETEFFKCLAGSWIVSC